MFQFGTSAQPTKKFESFGLKKKKNIMLRAVGKMGRDGRVGKGKNIVFASRTHIL